MSIKHVPNENRDNEFPFAYLPSIESDTGEEKLVGTGWESVVKQLGPDWVMKEVNPLDPKGSELPQVLLDHFRSPDRVKMIVEEQNRLEEIFGPEHFVKSHFVYGKDQNGQERYILVQKFVPGPTLSELVRSEYGTTKETVRANREEMMEIIWGAKKAIIEFGAPPDFHPGNLIRDERTGNIVMIDAGMPSEQFAIMNMDGNSERTKLAFTKAFKKINRIARYEGFLQLSEEEREKLNEKYQITDEEYAERVGDIERLRAGKGIGRETEEEDNLGTFLNGIFGERREVKGQEIYDYAMGLLRQQKPTRSQEQILGELIRQSETLGDKKYWRELIEKGSDEI